MTRYLLGRVLSLVASLLAASIIIFLILEVVPGDPAQFMLGCCSGLGCRCLWPCSH